MKWDIGCFSYWKVRLWVWLYDFPEIRYCTVQCMKPDFMVLPEIWYIADRIYKKWSVFIHKHVTWKKSHRTIISVVSINYDSVLSRCLLKPDLKQKDLNPVSKFHECKLHSHGLTIYQSVGEMFHCYKYLRVSWNILLKYSMIREKKMCFLLSSSTPLNSCSLLLSHLTNPSSSCFFCLTSVSWMLEWDGIMYTGTVFWLPYISSWLLVFFWHTRLLFKYA